MKVKSESEVAQSCPPLLDPMDCSLPGSSVHGIFQARVLEWGALAFSVFKVSNPVQNLPAFVHSLMPLGHCFFSFVQNFQLLSTGGRGISQAALEGEDRL